MENNILEIARAIENLNERLNYLNNLYSNISDKKHGKTKILKQISDEIKTEINKTEDEILLQKIENEAKEQEYQKGILYLIDVKQTYNITKNEEYPLKIKNLSKLKYYNYKEFVEMVTKVIEQYKKNHINTELPGLKPKRKSNITFNIKPVELVELIKALQFNNKVSGTQRDIIQEFADFFKVKLSENSFTSNYSNIQKRKPIKATFIDNLGNKFKDKVLKDVEKKDEK